MVFPQSEKYIPSRAGAALAHYERWIATIGGMRPGVATTSGSSLRVYYSPLIIKHPVTIDRLGINWGNPAANNFYLAIYDSALGAPVNRLGVTANTAAAGIDQKQQVALTVASLLVNPGLYFLANIHSDFAEAFRCNQTTFTIMNPAGVADGPSWYREDLVGYGIPPAVATPVQQYDHPVLLWVQVLSVP